MIELKNVGYKIFDEETGKEKEIIKNLNIVFPENKVTVITGHNGSGKSTLLKILMGILPCSDGNVFFDGQNINEKNITERANLGMTIAFQLPVKFKGLTVQDLLNAASKNPNNISEACEFLAKVGLCAKDYLKRELDETLSGGELKRIELALALSKGGKVLLFDEPEAGIDLWSFDDLIGLFKSLKNKTVIVVSHQKKLIETADYILLLDRKNAPILGKREEMMSNLQSPQCRKLGGMING